MFTKEYVIIAVIALISFIIAHIKGTKWQADNAEKLGFKWGYFVIFSALITYGGIFALSATYFALSVANLAVNKSDFDAFLFILGLFSLFIIVVVKALERRKWALVLITLLSFNPFWMIINHILFTKSVV